MTQAVKRDSGTPEAFGEHVEGRPPPERTAALPAEVPLGAFPAGSEGTFIWLIARTLYKQ